jgi:hypothetical protein
MACKELISITSCIEILNRIVDKAAALGYCSLDTDDPHKNIQTIKNTYKNFDTRGFQGINGVNGLSDIISQIITNRSINKSDNSSSNNIDSAVDITKIRSKAYLEANTTINEVLKTQKSC